MKNYNLKFNQLINNFVYLHMEIVILKVKKIEKVYQLLIL